jgi:RNA polymerase sigma-70 factor (ECF subfamily)
MPPVTVQLTEVLRRDDTGLVRRARDGDLEAFDAIAVAFLPDAFRLASAILGREAEAADASQNAFVAAWRELPNLREVDRFEAWFHRILVNECRMQLRRRSRAREVPLDVVEGPASRPAQPPLPPLADRVEAIDLIERAFDQLEPDDRTIVVLHHLEGRPLAEIAEIVHVPVGTVKWRLHEARKTLQGALEAIR